MRKWLRSFEHIGAATSGGLNAAFGYLALNTITTGSANTALGAYAGGALTGTDSNNVCINNI